MKTELWNKVKQGDYLIYADPDDGVQKAKVTEIDITIEVFEPEHRKEQPYGLTADQGYVKISWKVDEVEKEIVQNLANLIRFNLTWYTKLKKAYEDAETSKATAEGYLNTFVDLRAELREA